MQTIKHVVFTYLTALVLGFSLSLSAQAAGSSGDAPAQKGPKDKVTLLQKVVEINDATGEFSTLKAAVLAADPAVVMTLSSNGQHTVFAPTDEAFSLLSLDASNIGSAFDQETLTAILLYHVVNGRQLAEDVLAADQLNTLLRGRDGFLQQSGGVLTDNVGGTATIIDTDVEVTNGVIHVINAVVLPFMPE
jgi:uncharacterized surface protein with fasciclin (FAS1) repeats